MPVKLKPCLVLLTLFLFFDTMLKSMWNFFLQILAGILGLYLAAEFLSGVEFHGSIKTFLLAGVALGLLNFFIKPILNLFLFPLRLLTFGLIGLVINIGIVFFVAYILFPGNFKISGFLPLLFTTFIISFLSTFFFSLTKSFIEK
jgi:putative membrane protein